MSDLRDPAAMIEAAQQAAATAEFAAAERLLRDAAAIQEATLGSSHVDLATTLNNLAFVCERTNKIEEAERGYRRAHAIAVASLPPGDPMIATSLKNLVDFCAAHEIPIWKPLATGLEDEAPAPVQATRRGRAPLRTIALSALGVVVIVAVALTIKGRRPIPQAGSPAGEQTAPVVQPRSEPDIAPDKPLERKSAPVEQSTPAETSVPASAVTVLKAQLCSALEKAGSPDWQCTAATGDLPPGTYTFYTRLLTDTNTTVEHRWYRDERVQRVVRLRVTASPGTGYRTFSSTTIGGDRAGEWRVELRAADGTLLHEVRVVVR